MRLKATYHKIFVFVSFLLCFTACKKETINETVEKNPEILELNDFFEATGFGTEIIGQGILTSCRIDSNQYSHVYTFGNDIVLDNEELLISGEYVEIYWQTDEALVSNRYCIQGEWIDGFGNVKDTLTGNISLQILNGFSVEGKLLLTNSSRELLEGNFVSLSYGCTLRAAAFQRNRIKTVPGSLQFEQLGTTGGSLLNSVVQSCNSFSPNQPSTSTLILGAEEIYQRADCTADIESDVNVMIFIPNHDDLSTEKLYSGYLVQGALTFLDVSDDLTTDFFQTNGDSAKIVINYIDDFRIEGSCEAQNNSGLEQSKIIFNSTIVSCSE